MSEIRDIAYTTERSDVFEVVPPMAITILDVDCSYGVLGACPAGAEEFILNKARRWRADHWM